MLANKKSDMFIMIGHQSRLSINDCKLISSGHYQITMDHQSRENMQKSYEFLRAALDKRIPIYGINTQFGDQVNYIDPHLHHHQDAYYQSIAERQTNLIKSHCAGLGNSLPSEVVRVAMALRAQCLSQGYSGVRPEVVQAILGFLNKGITPIVRQYGSIGASGDLIPLASIATALIGEETDVVYQGRLMPAKTAMAMAKLKRFSPTLREGLAMINGTSFMSAIASLAMYDLNRLFKQMLTTIAMTLESLLVIQSAYHPLVHQLKNQQGEIEVNDFIVKCWKGSQLVTDLDELRLNMNDMNIDHQRRVQDYYSIRSVAQGFGPFMENLQQATTWVENEINCVNDNPIIDVAEQKIHHGANFMGYYITDACDILKMNIAQASTWIHALLANMVHPRKNQHLPTSLVAHPEINNGFRPLQLLAASIAVQNRKFAQSHQAYMLPTEGDNQDVNSLGTHAALDLKEAVDNLERLTAILLIAAVQALEFRGIQQASAKAQSIHKKCRKICPAIDACRPLTNELNHVISALKSNELITY